MVRFEVKQEQEDLWSVSIRGRTLYFYSSEEDARWAALMLASDTSQSGVQASVVITPPELTQFHQGPGRVQQFTGM